MTYFTYRKTLLTASVAMSFLVGATGHAFADIDNTATVTATPPSGADITAQDTETIFLEAPDPEMTVTKTFVSLSDDQGDDDDAPDGGDIITYQIAVENTGNQTLTNVSVSDNGPTFGSGSAAPTGTVNPPTLISGDTDNDSELDVDETWTYTFTYELDQADVDNAAGESFTNDVVATAEDQDGGTVQPVDPGSTLSVTETMPLAPSATLEKIATRDGSTEDDGSANAYTAGETVTYVFTVENTGNVTLTGVTVSEDAFDGQGTMSSITPATATLAPGASETFTATYVIQQADIDNQ
jgi:uncharacterized repeat protein (TIGR01451 family)